MTLVDIIIPAYNAHNVIERLLSSIICQMNWPEIKVTIVNDMSDNNYFDIVNHYSKYTNIQEILTPSKNGIGFARQYGVDNTSAPYIMFCDADDALYSCVTVKTLLSAFNDSSVAASYSSIMQSSNSEGYNFRSDHFTWVFGSMFRRSFLKSNNIRFLNSSAGEDIAFNEEVRLAADEQQIKFTDEVGYLWTDWNSLNRESNDLFNYVTSKDELIENLISVFDKQDVTDKVIIEVARCFIKHSFINYILACNSLGKNYANETIKSSKRFYEVLYSRFEHMYSKDFIQAVIDSELEYANSIRANIKNYISFDDWLNKVKET